MIYFILEPRSLLILQDDMYKVFLHGIKEVSQDKLIPENIFNFSKLNKTYGDSENLVERQTRISLTIRYVPKVLKINVNSLLFKGKK